MVSQLIKNTATATSKTKQNKKQKKQPKTKSNYSKKQTKKTKKKQLFPLRWGRLDGIVIIFSMYGSV